MKQKLMVKEGILLKDPTQESRLATELVEKIEDAFSRMFIPTVAFDEGKIKRKLVRAKVILNKLVG